ncbi:MAG: tRNA (adenosine(37)-N6)-dimethylallyltransferase MiaA [Chitinispirillaceae bacterium]
MRKIEVPVILGPTAVGKSELALQLADGFGYDILSCDSRQIYKFMNIGTAKPSESELGRVKHWLVDIISPDEPYSAFNFAEDAASIIRKQHRDGKKVLICGGTGLYFHTLFSGMGMCTVSDKQTRIHLQNRATVEGTERLHEELRKVDPETALKIHSNDLQRIIRALDIYYQTGKPMTLLQKTGNPPEDMEFFVFVLTRSRDDLYKRINMRVEDMFSRGLREEFRKLRMMGFDENSPGMVSVGYRELFAVEEKRMDLQRAVELIKQNTRHYAKRQMTWFRNKTRGFHLDITSGAEKIQDWFCSRSANCRTEV